MHRVGTRSARPTVSPTVPSITAFLTIHHARGDGENRVGRYGASIGAQLLNFLHEAFNQVAGDIVDAGIVVTKLRVFASMAKSIARPSSSRIGLTLAYLIADSESTAINKPAMPQGMVRRRGRAGFWRQRRLR